MPTMFTEVVEETFDRLDGDIERIKRYLDRRLRTDAALRAAIIDEELLFLRNGRMQKQHKATRDNIIKAQHAVHHNEENFAALHRNAINALMNWPLLGGIKLRLATRPVLVRTGDHYEAQSHSMMITGRWVRSLQAEMPDDVQVVERVIAPERVHELWERAQ